MRSALAQHDLEAHRAALTGHCYRMLGSALDADDAVQETLIRAWKSLDRFDGRSSLRTWLYRIATNVCLDALSDTSCRFRPFDEFPVGTVDSEPITRDRTHWLEPIPDGRALPADADPGEQLVLKESIRLAFVAALQYLPPKQRAVLLLSDVLGWSAAEIAESLGTSVAAVNSALQRARATMANRTGEAQPSTLSDRQKELLERYYTAFEQFDVDTLTALLCEDATFSMPPYALWLSGPESVRKWLFGPGCGCKGSRLIRTTANGLPAFGQYRPSATSIPPGPPDGPHRPWALIVLELRGDRIARWNTFLDTEHLFPLFGLPSELPRG